MAELEHKYCPTTRLSGRIRVGNVLSYHENKNIAFSSMAKVFGKVTKISTKGKKAPSPEVASLTINERILSFNFNYTGVFSSLCDKTVLYSVRNLCIELKVYSFSVKCSCARSSCQCS